MRSSSRRILALPGRIAANPLWLALATVALVAVLRMRHGVDADVSWQLWIAHQVNSGAHLYRDIIETNPPLWFWMAMPVDWLAGLIHVRSDQVLIAVIACWACMSLAATNRLLDAIDGPSRCLLLTYAALVLVGMPWLQFGQREQIGLIVTLPYVALIAARRAGRPVSVQLAFLVGTSAAAGFALKHYFLLVPIVLELWLIVSAGKKWRPLRAETVALVAAGALYAGAWAVWSPDYFSVQLPLIILAYGVTGAERLVDLFQPPVLLGLAILGLLATQWRILRSEQTGFAIGMTIAGSVFAAAYFIQAKGWSYQAVPLMGCAAMALASSLTAQVRTRLVILAAPALLCLPFWIAAQQAMHQTPVSADVDRALQGLRPGDAVGFIGTDPALAWPVTLQHGFRYPSRYNGFWMMRAVVKNEHSESPDSRITDLGSRVVSDTVHDFRCLPPKRIIVARPTPAAARAGEFDILAFFLRDPEFARLLAHYRPLARTSVESFQLVSPLEAGVACVRRAEPQAN
jgi:hypothetical protein